MAADSAPPDKTTDELSELRTKVAKLTEINRALMQRVEHGLDLHGNAYHLFQAAIDDPFLHLEVGNAIPE